MAGNTASSDGNAKPASAAGILMFAVDGRPRANRSKNTKSRSGCITCKKRRIRCDEGKPSCLNCAKSKRTCEGYAQKPTPGERTQPMGDARPLLIKPNYESHLFTGQLQKDHFEYWMAFTKEFTLFPTDLMTHLMPQIARDEPAIRYAAFAIGAATMGSDSRLQRTSSTGPFMEEALKHYGRAIQIIRNSEASRKSVPRALLSCLLFVTFESLQGNHKTALTHINHGCSMLDQVTRQGVCGECPPKLVEEVYNAFRRFTLLTWSVNGYHPQETETFVPWCCKGRRSRYAIDEIPASFDDLLEARRWWETVQHHVIYKTNMKSGFRFEDVLTPTTKSQLSPEEAKTYVGLLECWRDRFRPLMKGVTRRKSSNPQAYLQMVSLRLMYLSLELAIKSCHYTDLEVLASSTTEFKAMVSLSRIMLAGQSTVDSPKEVFTMDVGPSWPLLVAGVFCTDAPTREEALQLFNDYPRRDGLWDSRVFATILRGSQFERAQKNSNYQEHWAEIFLDKEIVIGQNEIRRRRYGLDESGGNWLVEVEETYYYDSE